MGWCCSVVTIAFLILLVLFITVYCISKDKYKNFLQDVNKKEYVLKEFIPAGLYLLEKTGYKFTSKYDIKLQTKTGEIYGIKNSMYYVKIHWANKIVLIYILAMFMIFVGIFAENTGTVFWAFFIIICFTVFYLLDKELNQKVEKRRLELKYDFPDFLNKLILLIDAGMTVSSALDKIVSDNKSTRALYKELKIVISEIQSGKSQIQAYEDFARRCKVHEITKFISTLVQNIKKGSSEMVSMLGLQVYECWQMRKNVAKRLGEEASTKLLFPMMIIFMAILLIVLTPVIMAIKGG